MKAPTTVKVSKPFTDKETAEQYKAGDEYPVGQVTAERLEELQAAGVLTKGKGAKDEPASNPTSGS